MTANTRPRVGVIGTGAIGGFYGAMLARAGFDVHFLLRSEYAAVRDNGLLINSLVHGTLHVPQVQAYQNVADMPACELILVGAKTTSNHELAPLINQLAAPNAKVLLLQNGYGAEEALRPVLNQSLHLLGGLCFICIHRAAPGVIEHQAQGMVNVGYHSGPSDAAGQLAISAEIAGYFTEAGVGSNAIADLEHGRWHKLVWNMPFNGLSALLDASTHTLIGQADTHALLKDLMQEVILGAKACGHEMPAQIVDLMLAGTLKIPDYLPSMYHDFKYQRAMELDSMYVQPLAAAKARGQALPKLEMLYQSLQFLQARNGA